MGFSVTYIEENVGSVPRMLGRPGKIRPDENQLLFFVWYRNKKMAVHFFGRISTAQKVRSNRFVLKIETPI